MNPPPYLDPLISILYFSFTAINKTVVSPIADKREKVINLEPEQRFPVEAGDLIGNFFIIHVHSFKKWI